MSSHLLSDTRRQVSRKLFAALLVASVAIPVLGSVVSADEHVAVGTEPTTTEVITVAPSPEDELAEVNFAPGQGHTVDYDGDGLTDAMERSYGLDPYRFDSDYDGLSDGGEFYNQFGYTDPLKYDTDFDGLGDGAEYFTYRTNPWLYDTDSDGYSDGREVMMGRNPLVAGI